MYLSLSLLFSLNFVLFSSPSFFSVTFSLSSDSLFFSLFLCVPVCVCLSFSIGTCLSPQLTPYSVSSLSLSFSFFVAVHADKAVYMENALLSQAFGFVLYRVRVPPSAGPSRLELKGEIMIQRQETAGRDTPPFGLQLTRELRGDREREWSRRTALAADCEKRNKRCKEMR